MLKKVIHGGRGGSFVAARHSSKARRLSSRLRARECVRAHENVCVCVWSYPGNPSVFVFLDLKISGIFICLSLSRVW